MTSEKTEVKRDIFEWKSIGLNDTIEPRFFTRKDWLKIGVTDLF